MTKAEALIEAKARDFLKGVVMGRRSFLVDAVSLSSIYTIGRGALGYVSDEHERPNQRNFPEVGWIEEFSSGNIPPFFNITGGNREFVRHMATKNSVIRPDIHVAYNRCFESGEPTLTQMFDTTMQIADNTISTIFPVFENMDELERVKQQMHFATYLMSAMLGHYLTQRDLLNMGIPEDELERNSVGYVYQWGNFPKIFPQNPDDYTFNDDNNIVARIDGRDRAPHFMQHFFVVYQSLVHRAEGNIHLQRIPETLNVFLDMLTTNEHSRASLFSFTAGTGWEVRESLPPFHIVSRGGVTSLVPGGLLFDGPDFLANDLGAQTAIDVHKRLFVEANPDISSILSRLEADEVTQRPV